MKFKNVVTYYLDGNPNGVRRCRIEGSVVEALVIPREAVKDAKTLANELPKHGIYFLIEDKEGIDLPKMYAGQTTNGIGRLYDHKANKEFWTLAVMFLSKDEHFRLDIISALESLAIKGIVESERYDSDNKVDPKFKISIYQQQVVENYFADIKFLMAALGWNIDKKPLGDKGEWQTKRNGIVAYGRYAEGRFDVLPGSRIDMEKPVNLEKYNEQRKSLLQSKQIIKDKQGRFILKKIVSFKTPSGASDFVLGGSTNGWAEWRNANGEPLDILRRGRLSHRSSTNIPRTSSRANSLNP